MTDYTKPAPLVEIAVSVGGYYLLRWFGVGVFWALIAPAVVVGVVAVSITVVRRRVDLIGALVLVEIAVSLGVSLATHSARVAAVREPAYVLVGGVFCLVTLVYRLPLSHLSAAAVATFGDAARARAFVAAWSVRRYRVWQRVLTLSIGVIMVGFSAVRIWVVWLSSDVGRAVDVSNWLGLGMIVVLVVVSAVLIQVPRRIISSLVS